MRNKKYMYIAFISDRINKMLDFTLGSFVGQAFYISADFLYWDKYSVQKYIFLKNIT